jgi:hypothetical protein
MMASLPRGYGSRYLESSLTTVIAAVQRLGGLRR